MRDKKFSATYEEDVPFAICTECALPRIVSSRENSLFSSSNFWREKNKLSLCSVHERTVSADSVEFFGVPGERKNINNLREFIRTSDKKWETSGGLAVDLTNRLLLRARSMWLTRSVARCGPFAMVERIFCNGENVSTSFARRAQ